MRRFQCRRRRSLEAIHLPCQSDAYATPWLEAAARAMHNAAQRPPLPRGRCVRATLDEDPAMRAQSPHRPLGTSPRPFPTRGVPGGWHDAWDDDDPLQSLLVALPHRSPQRRPMIEADQHLELLAEAQQDGRWVARVTTWNHPHPASPSSDLPPGWSPATWPSVNGPTAMAALDALEVELRDLIRHPLPEVDGAARS